MDALFLRLVSSSSCSLSFCTRVVDPGQYAVSVGGRRPDAMMRERGGEGGAPTDPPVSLEGLLLLWRVLLSRGTCLCHVVRVG